MHTYVLRGQKVRKGNETSLGNDVELPAGRPEQPSLKRSIISHKLIKEEHGLEKIVSENIFKYSKPGVWGKYCILIFTNS